MNWRRIFGWAVVIFIAWFLLTNPQGAAHAATSLFNALTSAGTSLSTFFESL